jgi:hypothetical protein
MVISTGACLTSKFDSKTSCRNICDTGRAAYAHQNSITPAWKRRATPDVRRTAIVISPTQRMSQF